MRRIGEDAKGELPEELSEVRYHLGVSAQRLRPSASRTVSQAFRLRTVRLLAMPEPGFARFVESLERESLFQRIRPYLRRSAPARFHLPLRGEEARASGFSIAGRERELELLRRIGLETVERAFLAASPGLSDEEVARLSGLRVEEAKRARAFLLALSVESHPLPADAAPGQRFTCVARLEPRGPAWLLPHLARGRYEVDYDGLKRFERAELDAGERAKLRRLLHDVEAINARGATLARLVALLAERQRRFVETGEEAALEPLTGVSAAGELGVHPSTLSRAVAGRSVLLPLGREVPLRRFLVSRREARIRAITSLLEEAPGLSDRELAALLAARGLGASRRTVNECRPDGGTGRA